MTYRRLFRWLAYSHKDGVIVVVGVAFDFVHHFVHETVSLWINIYPQLAEQVNNVRFCGILSLGVVWNKLMFFRTSWECQDTPAAQLCWHAACVIQSAWTSHWLWAVGATELCRWMSCKVTCTGWGTGGASRDPVLIAIFLRWNIL